MIDEEFTARVVRDELRPLFEQAEREGKWFFSRYQRLWFSPKELRIANAQGRFLWGAVNWELRDPLELIRDAENDARMVLAQLEEVRARVARASVIDSSGASS